MRRRHRSLFALLLTLSMPLGWAETAAEKATEQLATLTKSDSHAVAVLVSRDGRILFQKAFGLADVEKKSAATVETKFRIGSVTKQFVAAAILKLVDEKKLSLDDPLEKFFPKFPNAKAITVHQLLNHTSGIRSYTEKPEFYGRVEQPISPADLIAWFENDKPDFEPGKGFHYSNSAYFLAGEIVAKLRGQPLAAALREMFFEPLGMKDTGIFENASPPPNMAIGSAWTKKKTTTTLDWDMSWAGGAGALYSTVGDLHRWNEALHGGKILSAAAYQLMVTPHPLPPGVSGLEYGCGLMSFTAARLPALGHGGGLNGWSALLIWLPAQKASIAVLANAMPTNPALDPSTLAQKLAAEFFAEDIAKLPPQEIAQVDAKTYAQFVGRYDYTSAILTVTTENGKLYAQLTDQPKFEIFPKSPTRFFWKVLEAEVEFLRDESGKVTAARHTQGGNTIVAERLSESNLKLTDAELDALVGTYDYGTAKMSLIRDGDALFAQLTGQPRFRIFPKSPTEWEWRAVEARIVFTKDKDGKVTHGTHHQNGLSSKVPKIK